MSDLTYREAADYLNVSPATIKNWTRQGVLPSVPGYFIPRKELYKYKRKLTEGKAKRLNKRANKSSAKGTFVPEEYVHPSVNRKNIRKIAGELNNLDFDPAIILYTYFLLKSLRVKSVNSIRIEEELNNWFTELKSPELGDLAGKIEKLDLPEQGDTAGLIYQLLQKEGRKSSRGSYYTPGEHVDELFHLYEGQWKSFLDPCCGSGVFLLAAAKQCGDPNRVTGWDSDETAVHIARLNLLLQFPRIIFEPRIYVRDSLISSSEEKFDFIASNPPWGHHFSRRIKSKVEKLYPNIRSGESFSFFIEAALRHLNPQGVLSFLLPEALLKVKTHKDIREFILKKCTMRKVKYLGKIFKKVQTEVIRLDLQKCSYSEKTVVSRDNRIYSVLSSRFKENPHFIFDFNCTERDHCVLSKVLKRKHRTLGANADWILGVVSGNNNRFISDTCKPGHFPFISGQDIKPYQISVSEKYIHFDRDVLQQSASLKMYRLAPKIVYRFITGKPVFAIDRDGLITLNSANSFYIRDEIQPEIVIALFNSSLYRFILNKQFNSLKVLRSHLEYLPIPLLSDFDAAALKKLVVSGEDCSEPERESIHREIDRRVFNLFEIDHSDRHYIWELVK